MGDTPNRENRWRYANHPAKILGRYGTNHIPADGYTVKAFNMRQLIISYPPKLINKGDIWNH